ncbi:hypothetical protein DHEL01_v210847 [Diaporthe helianthi]|uniref:Uncharacterized protein n=1 Tax=Diaporthe helianthi TaxID=158607 RepID=A0A2P5HKI0_DIAHE|nr:hypothetical protein DHEL01_v210847 [Diaporthe helianthi]
MSEPAMSPPAKRLRLDNEPEQLLPDVAKPDNPPLESGSDEGPLLASRAESFDIRSFLIDFIRTDAGAADLAKALKDRHIRGVLKERGLKVNAADGIGYNSLPLELRDQIREYVIAGCEIDGPRCKNCPRLSAYACIDTEWRAAVEAVTFRALRMGDTTQTCNQDLGLFEQSLVGNRREYLKRISLPCMMSKDIWDLCINGLQGPGISTDSIHRLFHSMEQWQDADISPLEIQASTSSRSSVQNIVLAISTMALEYTSGYAGMHEESILALGRAVRHMPALQSLRVAATFGMSVPWDLRKDFSIMFTLEVFNIFITPDLLNYDHFSTFPLTVVRTMASDEMKEVWKRSLLKGANAVLEFHVEFEDALDEDDPDGDDFNEDDSGDDGPDDDDLDQDDHA